MQRAQRKLEHIKYAIELGDGPASTHFEDLRFLHNCLPEINPADIVVSGHMLGREIRFPFFIDAITGGTDAVVGINGKLAVLADFCGIPMAVGSQFGAVRDGSGLESYRIVRKNNPNGLVFANMSALATPKQAQIAVDMLQADALEIHLNAAQELFMTEGDKDYSGLLENIALIRDAVSVPVIIKETGCGIAAEQYALCKKYGFHVFNCAGAGGTNFPAIESRRAGIKLSDDFAGWGVPTCWSLIDGANALAMDDFLMASGGIRTAGDAAKAFALGADLVGITGPILRLILENDIKAAASYLLELMENVTKYLALLGCRSVYDLRNAPLIITGDTKDFIECRGYGLSSLCRSRRCSKSTKY